MTSNPPPPSPATIAELDAIVVHLNDVYDYWAVNTTTGNPFRVDVTSKGRSKFVEATNIAEALHAATELVFLPAVPPRPIWPDLEVVEDEPGRWTVRDSSGRSVGYSRPTKREAEAPASSSAASSTNSTRGGAKNPRRRQGRGRRLRSRRPDATTHPQPPPPQGVQHRRSAIPVHDPPPPERQYLSVIPLALGRARIIAHRGYSITDYDFLQGW